MVADSPSKSIVVRASSAFRADPEDVLVRVANVARLAVNAVRRVHLKLLARPIGLIFHLIDGWAIVHTRVPVFHDASPVADTEVGDPQV